MVRLKKVTVLLLFLTFSVIGKGVTNDNLTITKDIKFEVEIGTAIDLDLNPVIIDFGNIVRNNNDTITKTEYLKFKNAFTQDNIVTTSFPNGDLNQADQDYGKFNLEYQNNKDESYQDILPVYIKKIRGMTVRQGEDKIPITAEIRGVGKDQRLGKYKKTIKMNVMMTPKAPINSIRTSGMGGMR